MTKPEKGIVLNRRKRLSPTTPPRIYESEIAEVSSDVGLLTLETDDGKLGFLLNRQGATMLMLHLQVFLGEVEKH
ncbi:hypothetical protein C4375_03710 [Devosia sp. I507]|nr:hypothetical protein C4375_03710 [Devosia sp. I507]